MAIAVRSHKKDEAICRHCTTIVPRLVEEKRLQVQKLLPATGTNTHRQKHTHTDTDTHTGTDIVTHTATV